MSCEQMKAALVGLIYNEIEEADRRQLEEHLPSCQACSEELDGLRETSARIRGELGDPVEAPVFLLPRSMRSAHAAAPARRWRLAGLAAALLVAASFVTLAASNTRVERGPEGWAFQFSLLPRASANPAVLEEATRQIEQRMQEEMENLRASFASRMNQQRSDTLATVNRHLDQRERDTLRNVSQALDRHSSTLTEGFRDQADELERRNRAVEQFVGNEYNRTRQMIGTMYANSQPEMLRVVDQ